MTRRAWMLFAAMCLIWGIPYLLIRVAVRDVSPGTLVFARTAIGGLILVPFALRSGGYRVVLRNWRALVAFTAVEICGPWLLLGYAERQLSSSLTGLLVAAVPLVGILAARVAGVDTGGGGLGRYLGLSLGLAGVGMLLGLDVGAVRAGAMIEMVFVVLGYAVAPVIMSRYLSHLPNIPVVSASLLLAALAYLPFALTHRPTSLSAQSGWSVVTLGVVCTALAFVVFFALIGKVGPARATVFTYVNPAVAVLLGVLLLGEPFTLGIAVGFPLILVGSVLAARRPRARDGAAGPPASPPAVAEAVAATTVVDAPAVGGDQSMRISPLGVSKTAATNPFSPVPPASSSVE